MPPHRYWTSIAPSTAFSGIPRTIPTPPVHLKHLAGIRGDMPRSIQHRLFQVSLDDSAGYVQQARAPADRQAHEEHARTTADLRHQREELNTRTREYRPGIRCPPSFPSPTSRGYRRGHPRGRCSAGIPSSGPPFCCLVALRHSPTRGPCCLSSRSSKPWATALTAAPSASILAAPQPPPPAPPAALGRLHFRCHAASGLSRPHGLYGPHECVPGPSRDKTCRLGRHSALGLVPSLRRGSEKGETS